MHVTMAQQPVGQGGLFEGRMEIDGSVLRWLYDCGSNQTKSLRREIRNLGVGPIDIIFISHLHSDHINGINELLGRVPVSEVVLPYLKDIDRALLIGHDLEHNRLSREFRNFVVDPAGWFLQRGISRVSFIRSRSDGASPSDGPDVPPRPEGSPVSPDEIGPIKYNWSRPPIKSKKKGAIRYFDPGTSILVKANVVEIDWLLAPYAHRPAVKGAHKFLRRLRSRFGKQFSINTISRAVGTTSGRASLKFCYGAIASDQNFVSMSLYSGTQQLERR